MTARRTLFFVAVPSCLTNLLFCTWVLLGGESLSSAWRWVLGVTSPLVAFFLLASSLAVLWTGGRQEAELARAARKDPLTGLANRFQAEARLEDALERSRVSGRAVGVVFCDLNDFKVVNDVYGHSVGDRLLSAIGGRFADSVRPTDTVARYGGDELSLIHI